MSQEFPAAASLRAIKDAWPPWFGEQETARSAAPSGVAKPGESVESLVLRDRKAAPGSTIFTGLGPCLPMLGLDD